MIKAVLTVIFLISVNPPVLSSGRISFASAADSLIEPGKKNPLENPMLDSMYKNPSVMPDSDDINEHPSRIEATEIDYAVAILYPTKGNRGEGRLVFTKVDNEIRITGKIEGLRPGFHGMHIHESGNCNDPDAESAGAHFNPDGMPHSAPESLKRHTGDLGNISADENGTAVIELVDTKISFTGVNSIIGKSVIVHAEKDDLKSQPAGNSGKRILCGIIQVSENKDKKSKKM